MYSILRIPVYAYKCNAEMFLNTNVMESGASEEPLLVLKRSLK